MTALIQGPAVSLADIAKRLRKTPGEVEAEARELSIFVGWAWDGEPAVEVLDAARLVDGSARRQVDHEQRWRAHQDLTEGWEADRLAVHREAAQGAFNAAHRQGHGDPQATGEAQEAGREAVEVWEAQNPAPLFDGGQGIGRSLFNKIREAVR